MKRKIGVVCMSLMLAIALLAPAAMAADDQIAEALKSCEEQCNGDTECVKACQEQLKKQAAADKAQQQDKKQEETKE